MDVLNNLGIIGGSVVAVISSAFAYVNRDRYKTLIRDIYEPGNKELREQIATARTDIAELTQKNAILQTTIKEKESYTKHLEELNSRLPDLTKLTTDITALASQMSSNHREIMKQLTTKIKSPK